MSFFDIFKSDSSIVEIENLKTQTLKAKEIIISIIPFVDTIIEGYKGKVPEFV
jgi:hypothetical protein